MLSPTLSAPQSKFYTTQADICIYGGAAGGGKTFALLLDVLKDIQTPGFNAVIFREQSTQIHSPGGLLQESLAMYSQLPEDTKPLLKLTPYPQWRFFNGNTSLQFRHLTRDVSVFAWQGSQITCLCYDELTHFSSYIFWYMFSRNRSVSGVKPRIRATCNPDPDSWVAGFISWWIDEDTGYPIPERDGVLRWMIRTPEDEQIHWADTREELLNAHRGFITYATEEYGISQDDLIKSVTFIASKATDNKALMKANPSYIANLLALPLVERERLLGGNWKIRHSAGTFFKRGQIGEIRDVVPTDVHTWVRGWDLAATSEKESKNKDGARTASVLIGKRSNGRYIVADVTNGLLSSSEMRQLACIKAEEDMRLYGNVCTSFPQDPGQAGRDQAESLVRLLSGFDVEATIESGSKELRANPMAAQWQGGNFDVLKADWNMPYFEQLEAFPIGKVKDMVDAGSRAFNKVEQDRGFTMDRW